jgi:hypothetical protein
MEYVFVKLLPHSFRVLLVKATLFAVASGDLWGGG